MYTSRVIIFSLTFILALVSAVPLHHHHRRSKCPHKHLTSVPTSISPLADNLPSATPVPGAEESTSSAAASTASVSSSSHAASASKPTSSSKASSSPSSSSSAPSSSSPPSSPKSLGGLLKALFPVQDIVESWTTSSSSDDARPLDDSTLRPTRVLKGLSHKYTTMNGKKAMQIHFPEHSYNFQHEPKGGVSFYAPGPPDVDLTTAKEATFAYSILFPKGFDFVKGGKLPGIYGGNSEDGAVSCSGGRKDDDCFSARLMWRGEGAGEIYAYLPPSFDANKKVCNIKPQSDCNPTYGSSIGRGAFHFEPGQWVSVAQRVRLNDVGQENGELELFVDGKSAIKASGLVLRSSGAGKMRGLQMQSFFGGSTPDFASTKDQDLYFSDFSVAITDKL